MKRTLLSALALILSLNVLFAQNPKLVVAITVDQLRTDYLELLSPLFAENGMGMLMQKGAYFQNVQYPGASLDAASSTAMLMTGAYPSQTGVASSETFSHQQGRKLPTLADGDSYGAQNLRLSTLTDEVVVAGAGIGAAYSLAVDPQMAVIMGGHAPNAAMWINPHTGRWTASRASQMPSVTLPSLASRLDTMTWQPILPLDRYPGLPSNQRFYSFRYTFPSSGKDAYTRFLSSPLANREITDAAISLLRSLKLGARTNDATDILCLGYTLAPAQMAADNSTVATQDAYLRLDRDLDRLFDQIDKTVGLQNTIICLFSTGYFRDSAKPDDKFNIPGGEFSTQRASSLLNSYLTARHGNGNYIQALSLPYLYLDTNTLDAKGLSTEDVASEAALFLRKMSGVGSAYPTDLILTSGTPEAFSLSRTIDPMMAGHVHLTLAPGWTLVDDMVFPTTHTYTRNAVLLSPALIYADGVAPKRISESVEAVSLAPTVSQLLRLLPPNGSLAKPLPLSPNV